MQQPLSAGSPAALLKEKARGPAAHKVLYILYKMQDSCLDQTKAC